MSSCGNAPNGHLDTVGPCFPLGLQGRFRGRALAGSRRQEISYGWPSEPLGVGESAGLRRGHRVGLLTPNMAARGWAPRKCGQFRFAPRQSAGYWTSLVEVWSTEESATSLVLRESAQFASPGIGPEAIPVRGRKGPLRVSAVCM